MGIWWRPPLDGTLWLSLIMWDEASEESGVGGKLSLDQIFLGDAVSA